MRKVYLLVILLILPLFVYSADIPQPVGWVNDFAGVISPEYREKLNALIEELEQKTTAEIAVVTINSIAPYDEKEYARLLFDNWKPGKKGKDNGVLVLLAVKERLWRIETGYGIEGILPDGLCGEIGRNYMVPYFKEGKYGEGLYYGTAAIVGVISKNTGVEIADLRNKNFNPSVNRPPLTLKIILVGLFALLLFLYTWPGFFVVVGLFLFIQFIFMILAYETIKGLWLWLILAVIIKLLWWKFVPVPTFIKQIKRRYSSSFGNGGFWSGGFGGSWGGFGGGGGGGGGAGGGF